MWLVYPAGCLSLRYLQESVCGGSQMDVSKNEGKTPKMDGLFHGSNPIKMDDLGVPLFWKHPNRHWNFTT